MAFLLQSYAQSHSYNLSEPTEKIYLPEILNEVSGLTMVDQTTIACIQDELGIVFFFNLHSKKIMQQLHFEKEGDYEGITNVGNSLFILRSDGLITEIENYKSENFKVMGHETNIPAKDNEGLCHDFSNNRLLIGCKSKLEAASASKNIRAIFGFDLKSKKLTEKPIFEFDVNKLKAYAESQGIEMYDKITKTGIQKDGKLAFKISGIAIHPITQKLYIISAKDHLFFVMDGNGNPEYIERLEKEIFNKPEGITFLNNGDLLITNEGQDHKATLLRFNMKI